jgi:hypothetical protein
MRKTLLTFVGSAALAAAPLQAAVLPPSTGQVLWLSADSGVSTTGGVVTGWDDEGSNAETIDSTAGDPSLTTGVFFPNGTTHNVVNFDGSGDGLVLNGSIATAMAQQKLNIFVVANTTVDQNSGEFLTDYHNTGPSSFTSHGWAVGNADTPAPAGQLKWFTDPDGGDTLGSSTGLAVTPGSYYGIHMTVNPATGKTAETYGGPGSGSASEGTYGAGSNSITYDPSVSASLGFLNAFGGAQFLQGNIAEVLVYDDTGLTSDQIAAESAAVNAYISQRYFTTVSVPEPASLGMIALGAFGLLFRRRRD